MKTVKDYIIVRSETVEGLRNNVKGYLRKGWELYEGVVVTADSFHQRRVYLQVMIKTEAVNGESH